MRKRSSYSRYESASSIREGGLVGGLSLCFDPQRRGEGSEKGSVGVALTSLFFLLDVSDLAAGYSNKVSYGLTN